MTQEKFKQASNLWEEIDRLDLLIKQIADGTTINSHYSDYGYLVHLLGRMMYSVSREQEKRMLEKEFEEL